MEKVIEILKKKGKTQMWLAEELGISRVRITQILKQKDIKLQTAFKIADVLGVDVNELR